MKSRRWAALVALAIGASLTMAYALWIRAVWIDEGGHGISRGAALATIVQAPLVVISVGVAAWQVVQSARASRQQAVDSRALERERSRPYVAVSFDMEREWMNVYLDVMNYGPTAAHKVRVVIDPPLVTSLTEASQASRPHDAGFLTGVIGTLVPQQRLSTLVDVGPHRARALERGETLPTKFTAHVTYEDSAVTDAARGYEDDFTLDFGLLMDSTKVTRRTMHDLVDRIEKLTATIAKQ